MDVLMEPPVMPDGIFQAIYSRLRCIEKAIYRRHLSRWERVNPIYGSEKK